MIILLENESEFPVFIAQTDSNNELTNEEQSTLMNLINVAIKEKKVTLEKNPYGIDKNFKEKFNLKGRTTIINGSYNDRR